MATELVKKEPDIVIDLEDKTLKELAAQEEDRKEAKKQISAASASAPRAPFTEIRLHTGIGPLAYETSRGLVKVWSGEYILIYRYKTGEKYSDGTDIYAEDFLVVSKPAMEALQIAISPGDLPLSEDALTAELGRKRRGEKPHPDNSLPGPRPNPNPSVPQGPLGSSTNPIGGSESGKGPVRPTQLPAETPTPKK